MKYTFLVFFFFFKSFIVHHIIRSIELSFLNSRDKRTTQVNHTGPEEKPLGVSPKRTENEENWFIINFPEARCGGAGGGGDGGWVTDDEMK